MAGHYWVAKEARMQRAKDEAKRPVVHWCSQGFTTICGAKPKELRIAMDCKQVTCKNCIRTSVKEWNER